MTNWSLDTIDWDKFDASRVHPQLLALARGACLVEYNADAYTDYLRRVFADDPEIQTKFDTWGREEKRHGLAIARWVGLADPGFDFARSLAVFRAAYQQLPEEGESSVRGSRARELVARCIVECGTSSFYSALRDACREPVFNQICHLIAQDEVRHFNLFRKALESKYGPAEKLGVFSRTRVVIGRMMETSDEELSFAFRAGNFPDEPIEPRRRKEYSKDYMRRVSHLYAPEHFRLGLGLAMKAAGINASQRVRSLAGHIAHRLLRLRYPVSRAAPQLN